MAAPYNNNSGLTIVSPLLLFGFLRFEFLYFDVVIMRSR